MVRSLVYATEPSQDSPGRKPRSEHVVMKKRFLLVKLLTNLAQTSNLKPLYMDVDDVPWRAIVVTISSVRHDVATANALLPFMEYWQE